MLRPTRPPSRSCATGEIEVVGRIVGSTNNALLVTVTRPCPEPEPAGRIEAIYKPTVGERPLDDFPDGTLTRREVAAWLVSEAIGWDIVPPTLLRDGPFGEGMVQAYIEPDATVDVVAMVIEDDPRLRRMAVVRCGGQQHRPQGRPHPAGRRRPPHPRRRPRRVLLARAEAADGAVGLARRSRSPPTSWPACDRLRRRLAADGELARRAARRCWPGRGPRPRARRVDALLTAGASRPLADLAGDPLAAVLSAGRRTARRGELQRTRRSR